MIWREVICGRKWGKVYRVSLVVWGEEGLGWCGVRWCGVRRGLGEEGIGVRRLG